MVSFERDEFRYDDRRFRDDLRRQERLERMMDEELRQMDRERRPNPIMEVINDPNI